MLTTEVLILNGTIGAGKTTIGSSIHVLLENAQVPHCYLDLDALTYSYPPSGAFNRQTMLKSLAALWQIHRANGARHLVLSGVVEQRDEVAGYQRAIGDCEITIVRLTAPELRRLDRVTRREMGDSRDWHLARSVELENILDDSQCFDFEVSNDGVAPDIVAEQILKRLNWLPHKGGR